MWVAKGECWRWFSKDSGLELKLVNSLIDPKHKSNGLLYIVLFIGGLKVQALLNNLPNGDFYWLRRTSWTSSDDWPCLAHSEPLISLITFMMSVRNSHWGPQCEPWSITFLITNDNVITVKNSRNTTHTPLRSHRSAFEYTDTSFCCNVGRLS